MGEFQCPYGLFGDSDLVDILLSNDLSVESFNALTGFLVILTTSTALMRATSSLRFNALTGFLVILTFTRATTTLGVCAGLRFNALTGFLVILTCPAPTMDPSAICFCFNALTGFLVILTTRMAIASICTALIMFQCPYGLFGDSDVTRSIAQCWKTTVSMPLRAFW